MVLTVVIVIDVMLSYDYICMIKLVTITYCNEMRPNVTKYNEMRRKCVDSMSMIWYYSSTEKNFLKRRKEH